MTVFERQIRTKQWGQNILPDEWLNKSNEQTFVDLGNSLRLYGFSEAAALRFLGEAYSAVAGEFGD